MDQRITALLAESRRQRAESREMRAYAARARQECRTMRQAARAQVEASREIVRDLFDRTQRTAEEARDQGAARATRPAPAIVEQRMEHQP